MLRRFLYAWARWRAERRKAWFFVPITGPNGHIRRIDPWKALRGLEADFPLWESWCETLAAADSGKMMKLPNGDPLLEDVGRSVLGLAAAGRAVFGMKPFGPNGDGSTEHECCMTVMRFRPFMQKIILDNGIPPLRRENAPGGGLLSRFVEPDPI